MGGWILGHCKLHHKPHDIKFCKPHHTEWQYYRVHCIMIMNHTHLYTAQKQHAQVGEEMSMKRQNVLVSQNTGGG